MSEITGECTSIKNESTYVETILEFLYKVWWRIETTGLDLLPDQGPALIVGNTSGSIPWPALMLIYSLLKNADKSRTLYTLIDNHLIENETLSKFFSDLNFVPWSYDNAKQLLEKGEIIAIFPEDNSVIGKTITLRNRLARFDWTKFLPAVELNTPIYPLTTLGIDEANLVLYNSEFLSQFLKTKAFSITPFFPWLPFPFNLFTMPVPWKMKIMPAVCYNPTQDREGIQEQAKKVALRAEGEIQAEINRLLRRRSLFSSTP